MARKHTNGLNIKVRQTFNKHGSSFVVAARTVAESLESRCLLSTTADIIATFDRSTISTRAGLVRVGDTLYGTTASTVFSMPISGGTPTVLATLPSLSFDPTYGIVHPAESVLVLSGNTLYGTTANSIYSVPITGGTPTVIASFNGEPIGNLILSGNTFYGATYYGGNTFGAYGAQARGCGEVYSVPITGGAPDVLYNFAQDDSPTCGPVLANGSLYIATQNAAIIAVPIDGGTPTRFDAPRTSEDEAGNLTLFGSSLYGVTQNSIFSVPLSAGTSTTLATFDSNAGQFLNGGLLISGGRIYGTCMVGGPSQSSNGDGVGTVFSVPITGGTPTVLANFVGTGQQFPDGDLVLFDGALYGTTSDGQSINQDIGYGSVFKVPVSVSSATITATPPGNQTATAGLTNSFALGSFKQTDDAAPYDITVDWGDGSSETTLTMPGDGTIPSQSHTFAASGSDTVSLLISDVNGNAAATASFGVTVSSPGTEGLTLATVKNTIPNLIIIGTRPKGAIFARLSNTTGTPIRGTASFDVYAVGSDNSRTLVGTTRRFIKLPNQRSTAVAIAIKGALPAGSYTLLPEFTSGNDFSFAIAGPSVEVAEPQVTLAVNLPNVVPVVIPIHKIASPLISPF